MRNGLISNMSSDQSPPTDIEAADIESVRIDEEMEQSYIDYAMSVIAGRALPDARDGLKPVHRRILYAMEQLGVSASASHRKSSSIVGETMGDFHPHGDSAIYDTLVRMAQTFSMRYPLVDGQGNFGSLDDDPAAAMRYTEARMSPIAEELLADIDKETVDFQPNYDDRLEEPTVLPAAFPNLLVNGASGIAVGMSTKIPPHNLGEIIDATVHLIDNPDATVLDLMEYVKGPDFPTGGTVVGKDAIRQAYAEGRGRLRVRADYEIVERESGRDRIVITELPYQANKARLVERIAEDVNDGTIDGISDLRDESDRNGVRVVIECKRGTNPELVENQLLEHHLEVTFGVIMLALVDGQPQVLSLRDALEEYVAHRRTVVRRRTEHDLAEARDRAHILEGRLEAVTNADDVVELIRNAKDRAAAIDQLQETFAFSVDQAEHIVRMQLGSLTSMEADEIRTEYESVTTRIERLETILADQAELDAVIKDELQALNDTYGDERRTDIVADHGNVQRADLIPEEDVVIAVSQDDYIKRMPATQFDAQRRGGKGIIGADIKSGDRLQEVICTSTHDRLLVFTDRGHVYELTGYEIPEMGRTARGTAAVNLLDLDPDESIVAIRSATDVPEDGYVVTLTTNGYIKRTTIDAFENIHSPGIIAAAVDSDDQLVDVTLSDGSGTLLIGSADGMVIRFPESEVRTMGRTARGVKGIALTTDDRAIGVLALPDDPEGTLLTVTEHGYGKRTALSAYRTQSRYGKGLVDIDTGKRNGAVVAIAHVTADQHLIVYSHTGQIMRTRVEELSVYGRNTMGVTIMTLEGDDRVAALDTLSVPTA